ncbi:MAG: hypothetical protein IT158_17780 [Bryobacterales bacterium]|nr:hypothetical protein [Bryobacterales bacterium]
MDLTELVATLGICVVVPLAVLTVVYLSRRLQSQERIKAMEQGVNIPFEVADPRERAARTRRWGVVWIAVGLGMILSFAAGALIEQDRDTLMGSALGIIPLLIGGGLLIDYRYRSKELAAEEQVTPPEPAAR